MRKMLTSGMSAVVKYMEANNGFVPPTAGAGGSFPTPEVVTVTLRDSALLKLCSRSVASSQHKAFCMSSVKSYTLNGLVSGNLVGLFLVG